MALPSEIFDFFYKLTGSRILHGEMARLRCLNAGVHCKNPNFAFSPSILYAVRDLNSHKKQQSLSPYEKAKKRLLAIRRELQLINQSAASSLDEGFEETLTLHKLGLFVELGESFKTTNCIENVNRQLGTHTDRVDRWQNSNQRQRWVATAMMEIEPRLRTVKGHKFLKELRISMKKLNQKEIQTTVELKRAS